MLTANLGGFDTPVDPVSQNMPGGFDTAFHRFTDDNFPPITGLTPRLQYRIPKLFGWQMYPGYDAYLWFDASMSLPNPESLWYFTMLLTNENVDAVFFKHPWRKTIREEVEHIDIKLKEGNDYITSRYKNGFHNEQLEIIQLEQGYTDDHLYASNVFMYRNNDRMKEAMHFWWYYQSRYLTCDQVSLPYALYLAKAKVHVIQDDVFKSEYVSLVSKHN